MIEKSRQAIRILLGSAILVAVGFMFIPRFGQDPRYHLFADRRAILGIQNFWNVVSNLPFAAIGIWGVVFTLDEIGAQNFEYVSERWAYLVFFASLVLTCVGSSYYHLHPANSTLIWDRLPMAIGFMAIFSAVIAERIDPKIGVRLLLPLLALGIGSVLQWYWTEIHGVGDLRLYAVVQFFPTLTIPIMVLIIPSRYSHGKYFLTLCGFYALAKVLEYFDRAVFSVGGIVSGHTLKHLSAAAGTLWILQMLRRRSLERDQGRTAEVPGNSTLVTS